MIQKEEFYKVIKKYPPSKYIKFGFKYFSKSTKPEDMYVKKTITITLVVLFCLLMLGAVLDIKEPIMIIPISLFSLIIFGLAIYMTIIVQLNNRRLNKIIKELNISKEEYQGLINYYGEYKEV